MLNIMAQQISLTRGDDACIDVVMTNKLTNEKYVLEEGDAVYFRLRVSDQVILTKTCILDLTENTCQIVLLPADTIGLAYGEYRYEVELVTALGKHDTVVAYQKFIIGEEIENHG